MKVAILCGSVYGTAEEVARNAKQLLTDAGFEVLLNSRATLADVQRAVGCRRPATVADRY